MSDINLINQSVSQITENQKKIIELGEKIFEELKRRNDLEARRQKEEFSR